MQYLQVLKMSCESSIADLTMDMLEEDCREQLLPHITEVSMAVYLTVSIHYTISRIIHSNIQGRKKDI